MNRPVLLCVLIACFVSAVRPVNGDQQADALIPRAVERLRDAPSPDVVLGLAEMYRAAGNGGEARRVLERGVNDVAPGARQFLELICWRRLPEAANSGVVIYYQVGQLHRLGSAGEASPWTDVYRMMIAVGNGDREALMKAAAGVKAPPRFPTVEAEQAHFKLLTGLGLSRNAAALEVVSSRTYEPLYALRDLDRELGRQAAYFESVGRGQDAGTLLDARERLRTGWLAASRHLVERLFALKLAGKDQQRTDLARHAARLVWLTDPTLLQTRLAGMDRQRAWTSMLSPLLQSEVALIDSAPDENAGLAGVDLTIRAPTKRQKGAVTVYKGPIKATLGRVIITSQKLELSAAKDNGAMTLNGSGAVTIGGLPKLVRVVADRFTFDTSTGAFVLSGKVQLQGAGTVVKCTECVVNLSGTIVDKRTLLDEFAAEVDVHRRLAMLPEIFAAYEDDELPPEVAYLQAMKLLRNHLTWHAAHLPPKHPAERLSRKMLRELHDRTETRLRYDGSRWAEAHAGEAWMLDQGQRERLQRDWEAARRRRIDTARRAASKQGERDTVEIGETSAAGIPEQVPQYFWRLKDTAHDDILKAKKLLKRVTSGKLARKAYTWRKELDRNNAVVTIDVVGAYQSNKKGPVVIDVRNAGQLDVKLYRVRTAKDLVSVTQRIGEHFVYHDYGLQFEHRVKSPRGLRHVERILRARTEYAREIRKIPDFAPKDLVHQWIVPVAKLRVLNLQRDEYSHRRERDDPYDSEAERFDDRCERHRRRLEKSYWPGWERASSWQCDRLLEIPAEALKQPGAYVLVVEANGQRAYAPIVVDPLAMVLRRCRDGVFVMLSDTDNNKPVADAKIHADSMLGDAVTNADGVAFAKVFAAGQRAIIAVRDGRYAVGGFGDVFEGIYESDIDCWRNENESRVQREPRKRHAEQEMLAHAYTDRYVVAAYTDRPTYRPGQEVNFKLIVRHLPPASAVAAAEPATFRAGDFELAEHLEIPKDVEAVFEVLNPKGRSIGAGQLAINDFGTAAAKVSLSPEAKTGTYSIRVRVGGMDRIVPNVFTVKYYRRPNFELGVDGLPEEITGGSTLKLNLSGRYYFGKPVAGADCDVRLVHPHAWKPLAGDTRRLDHLGSAVAELKLPRRLKPGTYRLIGSLTDDSGRTVTQILTCNVAGRDDDVVGGNLSEVPRFLAAGETLAVTTSAGKVEAQSLDDADAKPQEFKTQRGTADVKLDRIGWHRLSAGEQRTTIFVYGGNDPPERRLDAQAAEADGFSYQPRWVNLADYDREQDGYSPASSHDQTTTLLTLFDRQHVEVGGKLRALVYVPHGEARLLLTVEGRTVVDYVAQHVEASKESGRYHIIDVPIKRRYLPNFYLQGRVVSFSRQLPTAVRAEELRRELEKLEEGDGTEDPPWCRIDVIDPNVQPGGRQLDVAIETDALQYEPGQEVDVRIKTTDLIGKPCAAEVSLAVVDESVFTFGEDRVDLLPALFADPHPQRRYRRKTWRASRGLFRLQEMELVQEQVAREMAMQKQVEQLAEMVRALEKLDNSVEGLDRLNLDRATPLAMLDGELPASSLPLARLRTDFRETAAWQPQLRTNAEGLAETTFTLPDSLTRYRLTGVGLTRDTRIGTGRSRIRVTMPLSVQLFLPRFAVEGDQLEVTGLVHNNSNKQQTCDVAWEVAGANVETPDAARSRVTVPAAGTVRVYWPLSFDRIGEASVTLRVTGGGHSDAEVRQLVVQPLGRPAEVAFTGTFTGRHKVSLPAGFVASDLRASISRTDVSGGLEGLAYLVDYPYGCVEQTMSRFLPSVMAKRAVQQAPVSLPPEVMKKLPDVLSKGLERLYNFQHDDGGWGWWQRDANNGTITTYVVYGLARCKSTSTHVNEEVLQAGCRYLKSRLRNSKEMTPALRARTLFALVLAGHADRATKEVLRQSAAEALAAKDGQPRIMADLALAARRAGLLEQGERLAAKLESWQPAATEDLARKLTVQITYGAPLDSCRQTAAKLLELRRGHRWGNTRATSWAIEALSQMLRYDPLPPEAKQVAVVVDGKTVLDLRQPDELKAAVCRVHLSGAELPTTEGFDVVLKLQGTKPAHFALTATGTQRLDRIEPTGTAIRIRRKLKTPEGKPLGPIRVGDVIAVHLRIDLAEPQPYLIVEDRRPAGFEHADDRIDGPLSAVAVNVEFRDDRVAAFFASLSAGRHELVYYLRAETPGTSHILPGVAYPMYNETIRGETGALSLRIVRPAERDE